MGINVSLAERLQPNLISFDRGNELIYGQQKLLMTNWPSRTRRVPPMSTLPANVDASSTDINKMKSFPACHTPVRQTDEKSDKLRLSVRRPAPALRPHV